MGKKISYYLFIGLIWFTKVLPFWVIYRFADFVYFLLAYVIRYRNEVIDKNLNKCFPDKTTKERNVIKRKFYKNLADIFVESIKGYSMTIDQVIKRYKAYNTEITDKYFDQGKDVIILSGHFANWEWAAAPTAYYFKHQPIVLYKPLSNPHIDKFIFDRRAKFGVHMASIYKTSEVFSMKKDKPGAYHLVADQFPPNTSRQIRVDFFNSVTPFLNGPEKYAHLNNIPVVYMDVKRVKRGHYALRIIDITDNPSALPENEVTRIYAKMLENTIKEQPQDWMWSHKRWKRELYSFD